MDLQSKNDYMELAKKICAPILEYYNKNSSIVSLPNRIVAAYDNQLADIESFARPLWALAGIVKEGDKETGKLIFSMIRNGINSRSSMYWGEIKPYSQAIVEMPSIMFFVFVNQSQFKKEFSNSEQKDFARWFLQINKVSYNKNNWQFFGILINEMLLQMKLNGSRKTIMSNWNNINHCYLGDGWYSDGESKQRDYYISFAYHFYSLLWVYINRKLESKIKTNIIERANQFAKDYIYFFDDNGSAIPYGRSLIYRFAQVAFWSVYRLVGLKDIPAGTVKGIINRNINWWLSQSIFNMDGTLNIGYTYPNLLMTEYYNATGSPYWCCKALVLLLLEDGDDFWKTEETTFPKIQGIRYMNASQFVIARRDGFPILFPADHQGALELGHSVAKYERFAYSTMFGFNVSKDDKTLKGKAFDSTIAISLRGVLVEKQQSIDTILENGVMKSIWKPDKNVMVKSYIFPGNPWHVRIFEVFTGEEIQFFDFGFPIEAENLKVYERNHEITLHAEKMKVKSIICNKYGNGILKYYIAAPNTNILFPKNAVPYTVWNLKKGSYYMVDMVCGGINHIDDRPEVKKIGKEIRVKNQSGYHTVFMDEHDTEPKNIWLNIKYIIKKIRGYIS